MNQRDQIYKCEVCGNIVEMKHPSIGELVCCGQPMRLIVSNTVDASKEKHLPYISKQDDSIFVTIGEVTHPMEENHYIEWIEVIDNEEICTKFLKPGDLPKAEFTAGEGAKVRAYCNVHGMWEK